MMQLETKTNKTTSEYGRLAKRGRFLRLGLCLPLLIQACGGIADGLDETDEAPIEEVQSPILTEQPNGAAEIITKFMDDPEIARVSYAMTDSGCSGSMIGPNVLMTAGHCGTHRTSWKFRVYEEGDINQRVTHSFQCEWMLSTYPDTDMLLYWCDDDPSTGLAPGDIYGYLEFDTYDPSTETPLYAIWNNPIDEYPGGALPWGTRIYSEGNVTSIDNEHWSAVNYPIGQLYNYYDPATESIEPNNPLHPNYQEYYWGRVQRTNVWVDQGGSGRPVMNGSTHRVTIGPQSTGSWDGPTSQSLSMADYLNYANTCPSCEGDDIVNQSLLSSEFGLSASTYTGTYLDTNNDNIIDVQQHAEAAVGEKARPFYRLAFDSRRRNALWNTSSFTSLNFSQGYAYINRTGTSSYYSTAMYHNDFPLEANTTYSVSFRTYTNAAAHNNALRVCFAQSGYDCEYIDIDPGAEGEYHAFDLTTNSTSWRYLQFAVKGGTNVRVYDLVVAERNAAADFDLFDSRDAFHNRNNDDRALVWPDGRTTSSRPDWAGVVKRDPSMPTYRGDWSLATRSLALGAGETARVCFYHRRAPSEPLTGGYGAMQVYDDGNYLTSSYASYSVGSGWSYRCSNWFTPQSDDVELVFGVNQYFNQTASGAYLVDDIVVQRQ